MIIHMVWLGNEYDKDIVEYTKKINLNHNLMLWLNDDLIPASWRTTYEKYATSPQQKSDLIRLCALRKYGGLYIDFDCVMKVDADNIVKDWNTFTIPSLCYSSILPGNILYCPKNWSYWSCVDQYVINYDNQKTSIITFDHFLYRSLPQKSYFVDNDCEKFPSEKRFITEKSQIIRYRSIIPKEQYFNS